MRNLENWLYAIWLLSKFGHRKVASNSIHASKLRLAGHQCDQKLSVGDQLVARVRLTFSFDVKPQRKTTLLVDESYDLFKEIYQNKPAPSLL